MRYEIIVGKEKLLCETKLLIFKKKFLENMRKSCCRKFFEEFLHQFFVKIVERSTDVEETKMTTTALPNQTNILKLKIQKCLQLGF